MTMPVQSFRAQSLQFLEPLILALVPHRHRPSTLVIQLSPGDNDVRIARDEACATSAQLLGSLDGACRTESEQVGFMARSWESFCEHICFLIHGRDVVKLDYPSLDEFAYQVVPDVDVLRPDVYSGAAGEVDRSLVVAVQAGLWLTRSQLFQYPPQPDRFLAASLMATYSDSDVEVDTVA